jgi:AraC family ethanolamine operon transcriptional activator
VYTFSLSSSEPEGLYFNQQPLRASAIGVLRPGQEFFVRRPAGLRSLVVYADAGLVERRCEALHGVGVGAFLRSATVPARQSAIASCIGQFAQVGRRAAAGDVPADDCARLSEDLVDAVLGAIEPSDGHFGWSGRQRLLDRAWRIVEEDTSVVSVGQLCTRLGVPIRTLDDSFKSGLGVSPKRFILALRLNRVRQQLSQADEGTTVTDVATSSGFFHFGHFSTHYRSLFGETPSQTLRMARGHRYAAPRSAG